MTPIAPRTFGSIDEDYRILGAAAERALQTCSFEIETKVSPFDWSLVLPPNPYMKKRRDAPMASEFDLNGEFFGLGELPCVFIDLLAEQVRYAQERGATRFSGRIDRCGQKAIEQVTEADLYAFKRLLEDEDVDSDTIWAEWAEAPYGDAAKALIPIMRKGVEMVEKSFYIDGNLFCQCHTPTPEFIMLGGGFAFFKPGVPMTFGKEMWSVKDERTTPSREAILREKDEAIAIADACTADVESLVDRIPEPQCTRLMAAWRKARHTTRMHRAMCRILLAYYEDMEAEAREPLRLMAAIEEARGLAASALGDFPEGLIRLFSAGIEEQAQFYSEAYAAEFAAKRDWLAEGELSDSMVVGGITDEWRIERQMHGSGFEFQDGRIVRLAGNPVFPNGYLRMKLHARSKGLCELRVRLHGSGGPCCVEANGAERILSPPEQGFEVVAVPVAADADGVVDVRLSKAAPNPPRIGGLAVR